MKRERTGDADADHGDIVRYVAQRLEQGQLVRRTLADGGRVTILRQLPFLCVYRRPADHDDLGAERLVITSPAYLIASSRRPRGLSRLIAQIAGSQAARFRGFLIIEVWSAGEPQNRAELNADASGETLPPDSGMKPLFRIFAQRVGRYGSTIETLQRALGEVQLPRTSTEVELVTGAPPYPSGMPPLLSSAESKQIGAFAIGLEIQPIYRNDAGQVLPRMLRALRTGVDRALKKTFFTFSATQTSHRPEHYFPLGRRALVKAAWEVDRQLAQVSDSFDLLLQVTPTNADDAWHEFRRQHFEQTPTFQYRPLKTDPATLKRALYAIPVEKIEDATLAQLFREKQDDLDRQITLLADLNSPKFLYGSLQIFGGVADPLLAIATEILHNLESRGDGERAGRGALDAVAFAARAQAEVDAYRALYPDFWASVQVREDMYSGLLVSQGRLLIGQETRIPARRVQALLSHEVGTHLVTYFNGLAQPLRQLHTGLPGYDELQEGLAVLSEYLVGGLSAARLRLLAGRVLAARLLTDGASFVDTFRMLVDAHAFSERVAYTVAMRIYRGGGLTKDAVYLRGLARILDYLYGGGDMDTLFVGKIASPHIPVVQELQNRGILRPIPLLPAYYTQPQSRRRLERVRRGLRLLDLVEGSS